MQRLTEPAESYAAACASVLPLRPADENCAGARELIVRKVVASVHLVLHVPQEARSIQPPVRAAFAPLVPSRPTQAPTNEARGSPSDRAGMRGRSARSESHSRQHRCCSRASPPTLSHACISVANHQPGAHRDACLGVIAAIYANPGATGADHSAAAHAKRSSRTLHRINLHCVQTLC